MVSLKVILLLTSIAFAISLPVLLILVVCRNAINKIRIKKEKEKEEVEKYM